jgi:hypothetical protein
MAEMMVDLVRSVAAPLTHETLHLWQAQVLRGRSDLRDVGRYRTDEAPMQIVSGRTHAPKVHFEAPPSGVVEREMDRFLAWFNGDAAHGAPSTLARAGIAHLHFESIHPFEDGNGRVGRAIAEKALAQCLSRRAARPVWCPIAAVLLARRGEYYAELGAASRSNDITRWSAWEPSGPRATTSPCRGAPRSGCASARTARCCARERRRPRVIFPDCPSDRADMVRHDACGSDLPHPRLRLDHRGPRGARRDREAGARR